MSIKKLTVFLFLLTLFMFCGNGKEKKSTDKNVGDNTKMKVQQEFSDFELKDLISEKNIKLSEAIKGKVGFINFWAEWCAPCKKEMPDLVRIQKELKDDVVIISVATGVKKLNVLNKLIKKFKLNFPALYDENSKVAKNYKIKKLPTSFIINREGNIINSFSGGHDYKYLKKILTSAIK